MPYRVIAEQAIEEWYLSLGPEPHELAYNESIEDLENGIDQKMYGVGGKPSIVSGVDGIVSHLKKIGIQLPDNITEQFTSEIMSGKGTEDSQIYNIIGNALDEVPNMEELVLDSLVVTHDDWVERSSTEATFAKKESKDQLHQYLPLELIGWDEAAKDLLFLEPILNACGKDIDIEKLKEAYNQRTLKFLEENNIKNQDDLKQYILNGQYEALSRTESGIEFKNRLTEDENLLAKMMENINKKGIGSVEQFLSEHKNTLTPSDIESAVSTLGIGNLEAGTNSIKTGVNDLDKTNGDDQPTNDEI